MKWNRGSGPRNGDDLANRIRRYQGTGDESLAEELIIRFQPMIQMAARKISRNRPDLYEDLFQVGQMSLLRSLKQFDCDLGHPFESYAMKSLVGHMKNYLRDKSWYIQVPRRIKEKGARIRKAIDELTVKLNRSPDIGEIADYLDLTREETIEVLAGRDHYQVASLDVPLNSREDSAALGDLIASDRNEYHQLEYRLDLQEAMGILGDIEKRVLHLVYNEGHSQRTIADELDISQMSVSRIQRKAISKLREYLT